MATPALIPNLRRELGPGHLALFALAYGLAQMMPLWASALIAALVGAVLAYVLVKSGLKAASPDHLSMDRTTNQVARDLRALSRKAETP